MLSMVMLALSRCAGISMGWIQREPTLSEILSDPIVEAVMKADRVDRAALERELRNLRQGDTR
jgi:hypothetical protein